MITLPLFVIAALVAPDGWDYPNTTGHQSTVATVGSEVVSTSFSSESDDSFDKVVAWYAKRSGFDAVPKHVAEYRNRSPEKPDYSSGTANAIKIDGADVSDATAVFNFTPEHMHVLFVFTEAMTGDLISISIAGNKKLTTINFVRRPQREEPAG